MPSSGISSRRARDKIEGQNSFGGVGGEVILRTVAVIALKGGSGKTTLATHLALAAHLRGLDTLLVDIDPQHSARDVLGARDEPGPACVTSSGSTLLAAQFAAVGVRKDLLIIDTPAGAVENVSEAIVLADLAVMVVRPTLLDIAGLARTFSIVRRLGKPSTVVVNQAPVARESVEAPLVKRALRALDYMQAPVAPVILRSRSVYQTALERGRSAEEMSDRAAAREMAALWDFIETRIAARRTDAEPA
jgi:chromosome partitioning protein